MRNDNDTINADNIKAEKISESNKYVIKDIDDEKVKKKIELSEKLKNKLILSPAGGNKGI